MKPFAPTLMTALLLCSACAVALADDAPAGQTAQAKGGQWFSYRNAYRAMIWFDKYGKPKNLIQQHYRIIPKGKDATLDGVKLTLSSNSTQLDLPLDAYGRAAFPLLKTAYDENAELRLNRKADDYARQPWISIAARTDGIYETADLRSACEQALAYSLYLGEASSRGKKCVGVRFSYRSDSAFPALAFRHAGQQTALPAGADNHPYRSVNFLFSSWPTQGQVVAGSMPIAIDPLFE